MYPLTLHTQAISYLLYGVNLKANYSFYDADWELKKDYVQRAGAGFDWDIYRGIRLTLEGRATIPEAGDPSVDNILFIHGYL